MGKNIQILDYILKFEENQPHSQKSPYQANKEVFLELGPHTALIHLVRTAISLQLKLTQCFQQADQGSKGQSGGETQNQIILKLKGHLEVVKMTHQGVFFVHDPGRGGVGGGTPYVCLHGEAPPKRGVFFRLQVYERIGISLVTCTKG